MILPPDSSIDMHCHLLPELDDGPADRTTSISMFRTLAEAGYNKVIATPHSHLCKRENILDRVKWANQIAEQYGINIKILPGTEIMITPDIPRLYKEGALLTLAEKGRHLLIELPIIQPYPYYLPKIVFQLGLQGIQVIIAHPERTLCFLQNPSRMEALLKQQVLFQITAASFTGLFGRRIKKFAYQILKQNNVHLIATDAHSPQSSRLVPLHKIKYLVAKAAGETAARRILYDNPVLIWQGKKI